MNTSPDQLQSQVDHGQVVCADGAEPLAVINPADGARGAGAITPPTGCRPPGAKQEDAIKPGDVPHWCKKIRDMSLETMQAMQADGQWKRVNDAIDDLLNNENPRMKRAGVKLRKELMDAETRRITALNEIAKTEQLASGGSGDGGPLAPGVIWREVVRVREALQVPSSVPS